MPFILTKEQLREIKAIIEKYHTAVVGMVLSPDALTEGEQLLLTEAGVDLTQPLEVIRQSYLFGQVTGHQESPKTENMSYSQFANHVRKNPVPLTAQEEHAVEAAEYRAAEHIRHLGARVSSQFADAVFEEDNKARAQLMQAARDEVAENIVKRESIGALKNRLGKIGEGYDRDWRRVAITEKHIAMQRGLVDSYKKQTGPETQVFVRPNEDACKYCKNHYLDSSGQPLIFNVGDIEANGDNVDRKAAEYLPVVPPLHPNCLCQTSRIPKDYGFNDKGQMVPDGKHKTVYKPPQDAETEKSDQEEPTLIKKLLPQYAADVSQMGNRQVNGRGSNFEMGIMPLMTPDRAAVKHPFIEDLEAYEEDERDIVPTLHPSEVPWSHVVRHVQKFVIPLELTEAAKMGRDNAEHNKEYVKQMGKDKLKGTIKNKAQA